MRPITFQLQRTKKIKVILLFLFISGVILAQKDTLSFLHITDTHVIFNLDGHHSDLMDYRKTMNYDEGENRLRVFLQSTPQKTNSDFVVITGDLVDFFEAETNDDKMLAIQAKQFSNLLDDYHIPVFPTLGNHDVFTLNWKNNKQVITQDNAGRSRALWIRSEPRFRNGTFYSESFQVGKTTYKLIFLDDSFYWFSPEDKLEVPYIDKTQLYWLNNQLNESDDDVEIIFMHIPLNDLNDKPDHVKEIYSALANNPSTKLVFAGHDHKNIISYHPSINGEKIIQVQTGALVKKDSNWRKISLTENDILISHPGVMDNELVIPIK